MKACKYKAIRAFAVCVAAVLCMSVPASAIELNGETLPDLPADSGYKYITIFDFYGYGAFYHNEDTLTITDNSVELPDAVLYRFSGEVWYLSGEEMKWTVNTAFCPLLYSDVPVQYGDGTVFYTPESTQEPTPEFSPEQLAEYIAIAQEQLVILREIAQQGDITQNIYIILLVSFVLIAGAFVTYMILKPLRYFF